MGRHERPVVGVTMGDPAGIGPEVTVKAIESIESIARPIVIGDAKCIETAIDIVDSDRVVLRLDHLDDVQTDTHSIPVLDLDIVDEVTYGVVRAEYGRASLEYVERAIELALDGTIDAIVTAPINKQSTKLAGSDHAGHTGLLAEQTDTDAYAMMLIEDDLTVTHVCTHVPLRSVSDIVTTDSVLETIRVTNEALGELGAENPRIAVAGLNPHAGDGGLLGDEDDREIRPAIEQAQNEGIDVEGPASPDTVFVQAAAGDFDCVVAMYHDQGHIPIKMLGFSSGDAVSGVNVTIGLPIIRTSVDHGTAFDIAGHGIASEQSMIDAIETAAVLAGERG